jgi:hypothetical protein
MTFGFLSLGILLFAASLSTYAYIAASEPAVSGDSPQAVTIQ